MSIRRKPRQRALPDSNRLSSMTTAELLDIVESSLMLAGPLYAGVRKNSVDEWSLQCLHTQLAQALMGVDELTRRSR